MHEIEVIYIAVRCFDPKEIPATKSDSSRKNTKHYLLKKALIEWLLIDDLEVLKSHYQDFDSVKIKNDEEGATFQPDVAYIRTLKNQTWIEIETDNFNVYNKIAKLQFCSKFEINEWPKIIIFGIEGVPSMRLFIEIFDDLCRTLEINEKRLYTVNLENKRIKRWR